MEEKVREWQKQRKHVYGGSGEWREEWEKEGRRRKERGTKTKLTISKLVKWMLDQSLDNEQWSGGNEIEGEILDEDGMEK